MENEKDTLQEVKYCEEHINGWKMRNAHCMTCNMARIVEKRGKGAKNHCLTWNSARNTEKRGK